MEKVGNDADAQDRKRRALRLFRKIQREVRAGLIAEYGELAIRDLAMAARLSALEHLRSCRSQGATLKSVALGLGLAPRTLSNWALREKQGRLHSSRPGRPKKRISPTAREAVLKLIRSGDPTLGVGRLKRKFPGVTRAALREMLRNERKARRARGR